MREHSGTNGKTLEQTQQPAAEVLTVPMMRSEIKNYFAALLPAMRPKAKQSLIALAWAAP